MAIAVFKVVALERVNGYGFFKLAVSFVRCNVVSVEIRLVGMGLFFVLLGAGGIEVFPFEVELFPLNSSNELGVGELPALSDRVAIVDAPCLPLRIATVVVAIVVSVPDEGVDEIVTITSLPFVFELYSVLSKVFATMDFTCTLVAVVVTCIVVVEWL